LEIPQRPIALRSSSAAPRFPSSTAAGRSGFPRPPDAARPPAPGMPRGEPAGGCPAHTVCPGAAEAACGDTVDSMAAGDYSV